MWPNHVNWKRRVVLTINVMAPFLFVALWLLGQFWIGLGIMFIAHMLLLFGTLIPNSELLGPVISKLETGTNEIWLTIDDGPDPQDTPALLDQLDEADAKATFFLIGEKAERHPDLVQDIVDRGHSIGNHTATHPATTFWCYGPAGIRREITKATQQIESAGAERPKLFRAPVGFKNIFVHPALQQNNMALAGWSCRGLDGSESDPNKILERLSAGMFPGSILLMHEGNEAEDGSRLAPQILAGILTMAKERDLNFTIPDEFK